MEKLEEKIQQREKVYLETVEAILMQEGTNRTKIALIYRHYIKWLLDIEDMVADAQFEPRTIEHLRVS